VSAEPGRSCPLHYRHGPAALAAAESVRADTAWIAGGLYGNVDALSALVERVSRDRDRGDGVELIFNGDFHWFDVDPADFARVQRVVLEHRATRGNVESELARPDADAGCGCAYPAFVDDATVARSNRIIERLRAAAAGMPEAAAALDRLPDVLRMEIHGLRVGIVHGDPESLAGWGLAVESLASRGGATGTDTVGRWARAGDVDAFACTHTCLPWTGRFGDVVVINNGSSGMPNFRGRRQGLATRIASAGDPAPDALYGVRAGDVRFEAVPIAYDADAWMSRFLRAWPTASAAYESYWTRIAQGPDFDLADALPFRQAAPS